MHLCSLSEPSFLLLVPAASWCRRCLPVWQVRACPDPVDEMQKMAEPLGLRDECGEGALGAPALSGSCLADNRLNLDVYPDGCCRFLQLFEGRQGEVVQVEFLRLSSNDRLLGTTLGILPHLKHVKSLVLKGKFLGLSLSSFSRLSFFFYPSFHICRTNRPWNCFVLVPLTTALALSLAQSCMHSRIQLLDFYFLPLFLQLPKERFLESGWVDAAAFSLAIL